MALAHAGHRPQRFAYVVNTGGARHPGHRDYQSFGTRLSHFDWMLMGGRSRQRIEFAL